MRNLLLVFFLLFSACRVQDFDAKFLLGEKLAEEQKFSDAVRVFRELYEQKKKEEVGLKALYRAALINWVYANKPTEARKDLETLLNQIGDENRQFAYEVKTSLAELLYSKIEDYESAIHVYKDLIAMEPRNEKSSFYQFRIGKSSFYLNNFDGALRAYQGVLTQYPTAPFLASVHFEIGNTFYSMGRYDEAIKEYQLVEMKWKGTQIALDALLGVVQCLEAKGQFNVALIVLRKIEPHSGAYRKSIEAQVATLTDRLNKISK